MSFPNIEHVVYINLDERTDRRAQVEEQLKIFGDRLQRFAAIKNKRGYIGCSESHIQVLKLAKQNNWRNVLIVEDDFIWKNMDNSNKLNNLLTTEYDVILLGGSYVKCTTTMRVIEAQTTTAYVVSLQYYDTLIKNFEEGLQLLKSTNEYNKYALDQYWKKIQPNDLWYIIIPGLAAQRPSYSDIEQQNVNYLSMFV